MTTMTMVGDYGQTYMNSVNAILTTPGIADPEDALMTAQYAYQNSVTTAVDVGGLDVTFFDIGGSDETVPDETVPGDGATNPGNDYNEYTTGP